MTKQERKVQAQAITHEIEQHELAIVHMNERMEAAEEREDEDEVKRLKGRISSSERTIRSAKEQLNLLGVDAEPKQAKGRTTQGRGRQQTRA